MLVAICAAIHTLAITLGAPVEGWGWWVISGGALSAVIKLTEPY